MSKLTDAYADFRAFVGTTLVDRKELPNAYELEDNSSLFLKHGYGVAYGDGINTSRRANGGYSASHNLIVYLTTLVTATENDVNRFVSIKASLYEIADTLIKAVETEPTLSGAVANIDWESYDQIETIIDANGTDKFMVLPLNFRIQYFEQ
jgi:hypothetical protein